jgi:hypothetical protein
MDPLSAVIIAGLAGGVSGKLAERAVDVVLPAFRDADKRAQREAAENTRAMLERFGDRLDDLVDRVGGREKAEQLMAEQLGTPDFSYTVRQALLGAARSNSEIRHEVISRAVVERIIAAPDSTQAVASGLAIEALGRLSGPQLDLLGLAAFVYYIAPVLHAPGEMPVPEGQSPQEQQTMMIEAGRQAVAAYVEYIDVQLNKHGIPSLISPMDFAHLVSASCASYDRALGRDLLEVLISHDERFLMENGLLNSVRRRLPELRRHSLWSVLTALWASGLQHVTIAPAGLIIGSIVHQYKTGEALQIRWDLSPSDVSTTGVVWRRGRGIDDAFYKALISRIEGDIRAKIRAGGSFGFNWPG